MRLEMPKENYINLKEFFAKYMPEMNISSVIMDEMLYKLGFSSYVPCIVEFEITKEQAEKIRDITYDLETFAVMSQEEPPYWWDPMVDDNWHPQKTKEEEEYDKYGWIAGLYYGFN